MPWRIFRQGGFARLRFFVAFERIYSKCSVSLVGSKVSLLDLKNYPELRKRD
jgi:hypothetical protein